MKILALSLFGLSLSVCLSAQWSVAPFAGGSLNNITSAKELGIQNMKPLASYFWGFQGKYDISERFGFGLALSYVGKGFQNESNLPTPESYSWHFNYFAASIFTEYRPIKSLGIQLSGGYGLLKSEALKIDGNNQPTNFQLGNNYEITATAGLRYYFENVFILLAYNRGLTPVFELSYTDVNGETLYNEKALNQSLQLGVGYNFHLKKK